MVRTVASWLRAPEPTASPAARWTTGAALAAAAATLVIADVFQLASHIVEPTKTEAIDRLEWIAANPDQATAAKSFDLLALPFLLGTTLVYVLLSRERSSCRRAGTDRVLFLDRQGTSGLLQAAKFELPPNDGFAPPQELPPGEVDRSRQ